MSSTPGPLSAQQGTARQGEGLAAPMLDASISVMAAGPDTDTPHRFAQHEHDGQDNTTPQDEPGSAMALALGGGAQAEVSYYCLRHGCSHGGARLRHWELEASRDGEAPWTTLRSHEGDESLAEGAFSTAGWAVEGGKGAFSHFRVRMTGKNSRGDDALCCAGIELYGSLMIPAQL
jgi:hypothetical protein